MVNLLILELRNNLLYEIAPELGMCFKLHKLDLSKNKLSSLPSELYQLRNLTYLDMGDSMLTSIFSSNTLDPFDSPPQPIITQGVMAILEYLEQQHMQKSEDALGKKKGKKNKVAPKKDRQYQTMVFSSPLSYCIKKTKGYWFQTWVVDRHGDTQ